MEGGRKETAQTARWRTDTSNGADEQTEEDRQRKRQADERRDGQAS